MFNQNRVLYCFKLLLSVLILIGSDFAFANPATLSPTTYYFGIKPVTNIVQTFPISISIPCLNTTFNNDPAPGLPKSCSITSITSSGAAFSSSSSIGKTSTIFTENQTITGNLSVTVSFGTPPGTSTWMVSKALAPGVTSYTCSQATFGSDPFPNDGSEQCCTDKGLTQNCVGKNQPIVVPMPSSCTIANFTNGLLNSTGVVNGNNCICQPGTIAPGNTFKTFGIYNNACAVCGAIPGKQLAVDTNTNSCVSCESGTQWVQNNNNNTDVYCEGGTN